MKPLNLKQFLLAPNHNLWIREPGLEIYVRKAHHIVAHKSCSTLDIANVSADEPGKRSWTAFMKTLHKHELKAFDGILIENVLNSRFADWCRRHDFTEQNYGNFQGSPSFYCPIKHLIPLARRL